MSSINKAIIIGNLGKDPEVVNFDNGGSLVKFPVATAEKYKNRNGELVESTEWHNITCGIPSTVKFVSTYLKKGNKVYVEGAIKTSSYEKEGHKFYSTEIQARNIQSLERVAPNPQDQNQASAPRDPHNGVANGDFPSDGQDDRVPF